MVVGRVGSVARSRETNKQPGRRKQAPKNKETKINCVHVHGDGWFKLGTVQIVNLHPRGQIGKLKLCAFCCAHGSLQAWLSISGSTEHK